MEKGGKMAAELLEVQPVAKPINLNGSAHPEKADYEAEMLRCARLFTLQLEEHADKVVAEEELIQLVGRYSERLDHLLGGFDETELELRD